MGKPVFRIIHNAQVFIAFCDILIDFFVVFNVFKCDLFLIVVFHVTYLLSRFHNHIIHSLQTYFSMFHKTFDVNMLVGVMHVAVWLIFKQRTECNTASLDCTCIRVPPPVCIKILPLFPLLFDMPALITK